MVRNHGQIFSDFPLCGIDTVFMDISMHYIEIIEIENKLSLYIESREILNNYIPNS